MIYLDNAANTKMSDGVKNRMLEVMNSECANPSSVHTAGRNAAETIASARFEIADSLCCGNDELYFTSGATESNNWAIYSAAAHMKKQGKRHLIVSAVEHSSVLAPALALKDEGFEVTVLPIDESGVADIGTLENAISKDTGFISIMSVNNETGNIQPIDKISDLCKKRGILFHTDAVQAVGNLPLNLTDLGADYVTFCAHKLHGPVGIGALYVKGGTELTPLIKGGGQQRGMRSGTLSAVLAAGFAKAVKDTVCGIGEKNERLIGYAKTLADGIGRINGSHLNGKGARIPSILNFSFDKVNGESLALLLDVGGVAVSSASACNAGEKQSHVIKAIGGDADSSIRISMSRYTSDDEIKEFLALLSETVAKLRALTGNG